MQWNDPTLTLTTASHSIIFNVASGDTYYNDPTQCAGLDMAPVRSTIDQKSQTDGGIIHTSFYDVRHITISGYLKNDTGTVAARETLSDALITALADCVNTDATLSWASAGHSVTVRCDIPVSYTGVFLKSYLFGLVAVNPTIS